MVMDLWQNVDKFVNKGETVLLKFRQSYFSSISPDAVILTNKRVIIIHNSFWGLYFNHNIMSPTQVSGVLLDNIMGTTTMTGKILSTVFIRIRGTGEESVSEGSGWHIAGLRTSAATLLSGMVIDMLENRSIKAAEVDLQTAKGMIEKGSSLIWLGVEQPDYVSYLLKIDQSNITRVNPTDIFNMSAEGLKQLEGKIFACYNGTISSEFTALLKNEYGVNTYALAGGLVGAVKGGIKEKDDVNKDQQG